DNGLRMFRGIMEAHRAAGRIMFGRDEDMMVAAFDESGQLHDSKMVVFGGCAADPDQWGALATKWKQLLDAAGLPYTHMRSAMGYNGVYTGWRHDLNPSDRETE